MPYRPCADATRERVAYIISPRDRSATPATYGTVDRYRQNHTGGYGSGEQGAFPRPLALPRQPGSMRLGAVSSHKHPLSMCRRTYLFVAWRARREHGARSLPRPGIIEVISKSPSRRSPVTVTHLPVTLCQICHRTVAYRPGNLSEALTEHYRRAHPEALDLASRQPIAESRHYSGLVHFSGMRLDVAKHGVRVVAFGIQVGVGVVFGDAPQAMLLVPVGGPPRVIREEAGDPRGVRGRGRMLMRLSSA